MPATLRNLDVEFVSLVDRAAVRDPSNPTEPQKFLLFKRESGTNLPPEGGNMPQTEAELRAELEKTQAERDEAVKKAEKLEKKLTKQSKPDGDGEQSKIDKSALPPEVRAALEKAETDAAETRKRAEKAEQLAKQERDERVRKEFIAKAEKDFPHLGGADELGPELMRMSEALSKDDFDAHLKRLTAANEQIAKGALFAELGKSGEPTVGSTDDLEPIQKRAAEIRKADPNVTEYAAMERAMREEREAQARYLASQR